MHSRRVSGHTEAIPFASLQAMLLLGVAAVLLFSRATPAAGADSDEPVDGIGGSLPAETVAIAVALADPDPDPTPALSHLPALFRSATGW